MDLVHSHHLSLATNHAITAANSRVVDLVKALLKAGADPNCRNSLDWNPLLVSAADIDCGKQHLHFSIFSGPLFCPSVESAITEHLFSPSSNEYTRE